MTAKNLEIPVRQNIQPFSAQPGSPPEQVVSRRESNTAKTLPDGFSSKGYPMIEIIEITAEFVRNEAPLYHNRVNQLRRLVGPNVAVYVGDRCGTVRNTWTGECFDWWLSETEEAAPGWPKVDILPAK